MYLKKVFSRYIGQGNYFEIVLQGQNDAGDSYNATIDISSVWIPEGRMARNLATQLGMTSNICANPFEFDKDPATVKVMNTDSSQNEAAAIDTHSTVVIKGNATYAPNEEIANNPDEMPKPNYDINAYLRENLQYPKMARARKAEGRVLVRFLVDKDGYISHPEIVRSVSEDLDKEAIRIIHLMPRWEPGKKNGKPVAVAYHLPITFRLK